MEEEKWEIDKAKWIGAINLKTKSRYDENGLDKHGFNKEGIHVITGTLFDENGYDRFGFDADGVNKYGININGEFSNSIEREYSVKYIKTLYKRLERIMDIIGMDEKLYSLYSKKFPILMIKQAQRIFNENGIDQYGFNKKGIHIQSKFSVDNDGYNALGYDLEGYDREGYDIYGFDKNRYDEYGYTIAGRDKEGYDRDGYDRQGYNKESLDRNGQKREREKAEPRRRKTKRGKQKPNKKKLFGIKKQSRKIR